MLNRLQGLSDSESLLNTAFKSGTHGLCLDALQADFWTASPWLYGLSITYFYKYIYVENQRGKSEGFPEIGSALLSSQQTLQIPSFQWGENEVVFDQHCWSSWAALHAPRGPVFALPPFHAFYYTRLVTLSITEISSIIFKAMWTTSMLRSLFPEMNHLPCALAAGLGYTAWHLCAQQADPMRIMTSVEWSPVPGLRLAVEAFGTFHQPSRVQERLYPMSLLISVGTCHPAPCLVTSAVSAATGAVWVDQGRRRKRHLEK